MASRLPGVKMLAKGQGSPTGTAGEPSAAKSGVGAMPIIGRLPVARQTLVLVILFTVLVAIIFGVLIVDNRTQTVGRVYVSSASRLVMLSQRLAKAADHAVKGDAVALAQLKESRLQFASLVETLSNGGSIGDTDAPPTPDEIRPTLDAVTMLWEQTDKNSQVVIAAERSLQEFRAASTVIAAANPKLQDLSEQLAAMKTGDAGSQLPLLAQRLAKNATAILAQDVVDPEVAFLLGRDAISFRTTLDTILASTDPDTRDRATELDRLYKPYQAAVTGIIANIQKLVAAKSSARMMFQDSETLKDASQKLVTAYQINLDDRTATVVAVAICLILAAAALVLIGRVNIANVGWRTAETGRQRQSADMLSRQNQQELK